MIASGLSEKLLNFLIVKDNLFPLNKHDIKKIYINISRLSLSDEMLYKAMTADLTDIFYKNPDSKEWKIYNSILEVTSGIESEERLLKVYQELQFLIALGNASYAGK